VAAGGTQEGAIFGTRFAKTQHADGARRSRRSARHFIDLECDLLDRNREPPDQPRKLVQMLGIVIPDGLREPNEAFVIAHRGYVARNERRHRFPQIGQDTWHRITSMKSGTMERRRGMSLFSARFEARGAAGSPDKAPYLDLCSAGSAQKPLRRK
jgi:hypothetical protein